jgi:hypothetical protein
VEVAVSKSLTVQMMMDQRDAVATEAHLEVDGQVSLVSCPWPPRGAAERRLNHRSPMSRRRFQEKAHVSTCVAPSKRLLGTSTHD